MNRISFKGARNILEDFSVRFLSVGAERMPPSEEIRVRYGGVLGSIASRRSVELERLLDIVDFLLANGVGEESIVRMIEENDGDLAGLAGDAELLAVCCSNGTITDVKIFEE